MCTQAEGCCAVDVTAEEEAAMGQGSQQPSQLKMKAPLIPTTSSMGSHEHVA